VGILTILLFALAALPLSAQEPSEHHSARGFGPAYDAAHETTINAIIEEVVTTHVAGSPAGLHLLVSSPDGAVDAHLGPFLTKETKDALLKGTPLQMVGSTVQLREKQYFLARELSIDGHTVTIRSARGFLVYPRGERLEKTKANGSASDQNKNKNQENGSSR
jgi:hypothetical protein